MRENKKIIQVDVFKQFFLPQFSKTIFFNIHIFWIFSNFGDIFIKQPFYNYLLLQQRMQNSNPFQPFINKMNNDLAGWLERQKLIKGFLNDYKNTLKYLSNDLASNQKLFVDHGQNIYSKAKTIDDRVVIRLKQGLFVQMSQKQAIKTTKQLIQLYNQKALSCQKQVAKIMTSMREVEELIRQYDSLANA